MKKKCVRCEVVCDIDNFVRCHRYKDGRVNTCKDCKKLLSKNHNKHKEPHQRAMAKYMKTSKGCASLKRYYEKAKKAGRHSAYASIQRAIKSGKLTRTNKCSICFIEGKTHFHHHVGYEKINVLNVVELCAPCHGIQHKKEMAGGL